MRVVFDTNVLVAAVVFPGGAGEAALMRVLAGADRLVLSKAIIDELLEVLARKFARDAEALSHVAVFFSEIGELVVPRRRLRVVEDEPDNRILECALAGRADAIVTGDKGLLALGRFREVQLITLRSYLEMK